MCTRLSYFTDFQKNPERWSLADFDAWAIANVPGANIMVAHRSFYKFLKTACASNENGINHTRRLLETKKVSATFRLIQRMTTVDGGSLCNSC